MYSSSEMQTLFGYLATHKHKNLHTRKTKQVNKKKVLKHLHGMHYKNSNVISGYFCGLMTGTTLMEIEYQIDKSGTITLNNYSGLRKSEAFDYIKNQSKEVMTKIKQIPNGYWANYKKNNFYLRRSGYASITPAANKALANNVLTTGFVKTMIKWNLNIIEGKG